MEFLHYQYLHSQTEATTGYFSCEPEPAPGLARLLELLQEKPLDTFLRNHALRRFAALKPGEAAPYFAAALPDSSPGGQSVLAAFGRELALLNPDFAAALPGLGR
ncbi:bacteriocin, partial [Desulfovibrio sp. OttesenSCG-928-C14]|nr:bacteriocin [Desulfovibrio sp. OttesenSCG-928-C14]